MNELLNKIATEYANNNSDLMYCRKREDTLIAYLKNRARYKKAVESGFLGSFKDYLHSRFLKRAKLVIEV